MLIKIDRVLSKRLKNIPGAEQIQAARVFIVFEEELKKIWGEKILTKVKPLYFRDKKLKISVMSSVVAAEIKLHEAEIISAINKKMKKKILEGLRFSG